MLYSTQNSPNFQRTPGFGTRIIGLKHLKDGGKKNAKYIDDGINQTLRIVKREYIHPLGGHIAKTTFAVIAHKGTSLLARLKTLPKMDFLQLQPITPKGKKAVTIHTSYSSEPLTTPLNVLVESGKNTLGIK